MPLVGAAADRTGRKKPLLAAAAYIGGRGDGGACSSWTATAICSAASLLIVANAAQSVAMMLYNSYLPQIAPPEERDAVSSRGWAFGYAAGSLVLVANLVLYTGPRVLRPLRGARRSASAWPRPACGGARSPSSRCGGCATGGTRASRPGRRPRPGLAAARGDRPRHAPPPADPGLPAGLPRLQRRRPDGDLPGVRVRLRGTRPGAVHADRGGPAGAGAGGGGRAGDGPAGPHVRGQAHDPRLAGRVDADPRGRVLPAGRAPVWFFVAGRRRSAWSSAAARRCRARCSPIWSRPARRPSTSPRTR